MGFVGSVAGAGVRTVARRLPAPEWSPAGATALRATVPATMGPTMAELHVTSAVADETIAKAFLIAIHETMRSFADPLPMLRHGLQDMHGRRLNTPTRAADSPSKDSLAIRFAEFSR